MLVLCFLIHGGEPPTPDTTDPAPDSLFRLDFREVAEVTLDSLYVGFQFELQFEREVQIIIKLHPQILIK